MRVGVAPARLVRFVAARTTGPTRGGRCRVRVETAFGLGNEFTGNDPRPSVAYLRKVRCDPGDIGDDGLASADDVVHVAAADERLVGEYERQLNHSLDNGVSVRVLTGQWLPLEFTGRAMHNFSYAHRVLQQPGDVAPNCFLLPMSKTSEWWDKSWMERSSARDLSGRANASRSAEAFLADADLHDVRP
jgi:hypothetical protein